MNEKKLLEKFEEEAPDYPDHTCPQIDNIIELLEKLRADNEALRESGRYWHEKTKELVEEFTLYKRMQRKKPKKCYKSKT